MFRYATATDRPCPASIPWMVLSLVLRAMLLWQSMTWMDAQPPYADGSVLRVTDMNGIRGNLNDTAAGLADAEGLDMFYATAENTIARLALGAEGAVMRGRSVPTWEAVVEGEQDISVTSNNGRRGHLGSLPADLCGGLMAWTDLSPYALAQVLHASDMNEIRLNLAETAPGIATAAGQLFYADGANSLDVLGISNGRILRAGANAPYYDALLTSAPADLTDNSDDGEIPTFGALRETFLPSAGLFAKLTTAGQEITRGTSIDIDLPAGKTFSDYRWIQMAVGNSENDIEVCSKYQPSGLRCARPRYCTVAGFDRTLGTMDPSYRCLDGVAEPLSVERRYLQ